MNVGSMVLLVAIGLLVGSTVRRRRDGKGARRRLAVAVFASIVAIVGAAVVLVAPAEAEDPEVCGYAKYDTDGGPTSTVPGVTYCQRPCGGWFVGGDPIDHGDVYLDAFACVRGV